jgi:hypothetical protein
VDWVRGKLLVKAGFEVSHNCRRDQPAAQPDRNVYLLQCGELRLRRAGLSANLGHLRRNSTPSTSTTATRRARSGATPAGTLRGLGNLPCYSYYSQTIGPTGLAFEHQRLGRLRTAQWQPNKLLVFSAGLRWEREQLPPPIAALWPIRSFR